MSRSGAGSFAALTVWFALAAPAWPAIAAPVEVVPRTPVPGCPDQPAVEQALSAQLGDGGPTRGWRLSYRGVHGAAAGVRGGGALQLELTDDRGQSRLRRQLRVEGSDCRAQAEAIALIAYRFFAQLGDAGEATPSPPAPPVLAPPAAAPAIPARSAATAPPATASARATAPARLRLSLEAGAGLWTRRPGAVTGIFGLRLAWGSAETAVSLLAPRAPAAERLAGGGEVERSALGMAISLAFARQGERLRVSGGPMSIVCREWGRSRGIARSAENAATTAALGVAGGASWRLWRDLGLGLEAGLGHAVFGDRFVVGGVGPVLAAPSWQAVALARLGYGFSR